MGEILERVMFGKLSMAAWKIGHELHFSNMGHFLCLTADYLRLFL